MCYTPNCQGMGRMEGHAAVVLDDRFIVVIGGWGPSSSNDVFVIDGNSIVNPSKSLSSSSSSFSTALLDRQVTTIQTETRNLPEFIYGEIISHLIFNNLNFHDNNRFLCSDGISNKFPSVWRL